MIWNYQPRATPQKKHAMQLKVHHRHCMFSRNQHELESPKSKKATLQNKKKIWKRNKMTTAEYTNQAEWQYFQPHSYYQG